MEHTSGICEVFLSEEEASQRLCYSQEVYVKEEENKFIINEKNALDPLQENIDFEECLIREIEKRPALWDHRIALSQRSKQIKDQLWLDVSLIFNKEVNDIQKKWRYIRDQFVRNIGEVDAYVPNGSCAKKKKTECKFFNSLQFLRDVVQKKHITTNIKFTPRPPSTSSASNEELNLTTLTKNFMSEVGKERICLKNKKDNIQNNDELYHLLTKTLKAPPLTPPLTPITETDGFLVILGAGLNRLPRRIRSNLQIKMLQMLYEAENEFTED